MNDGDSSNKLHCKSQGMISSKHTSCVDATVQTSAAQREILYMNIFPLTTVQPDFRDTLSAPSLVVRMYDTWAGLCHRRNRAGNMCLSTS